MVNSWRKKKKIKKYRIWRRKKKILYCRKCGKKLKKETHHFYCNECWNDKNKRR